MDSALHQRALQAVDSCQGEIFGLIQGQHP